MKNIVDQIFDCSEVWQDQILYTSRDGQATYAETRDAMLRIASWLTKQHGVQAGERVAICLPVTITAVHVILGILTAGASYLPLEFNGPLERAAEILAGSGTRIFLTTEAMAKKFAHKPNIAEWTCIVTVDPDLSASSAALSDFAPLTRPIATDPDSIAAIFFTSGSTGEPKGVMMSYASMTDQCGIYARHIPLRSNDRLLMVAPLHYAASLGIFFSLTAGCRSYLALAEEAMFAEVVGEILERERITLWEAASTRLRLLAEGGSLATRDLSAIRFVMFYGEPLPIDSLRAVTDLFPKAQLQNTYAASEAFWMMRYLVPRPIPRDLEKVPIGKPREDYALFLCDPEGNEVASGEVGEICVVGPVALVDYWKRPDLTAAARLNGIPNSYRTGDLARLGPDGNYYFAGRRDHQVKIRGHRFELGEIEAVIRSHALVREAVAFLVAEEVQACVLAENRNGLIAEIRTICARRLPVFARPVRIIVMEKFPQLPSGKVDRMTLQKTNNA